MKLKLRMRKLIQKHGKTVALEVLEEVAQEERVVRVEACLLLLWRIGEKGRGV